MGRNSIKEMKEILDAIEQGEKIQFQAVTDNTGEWADWCSTQPNFLSFRYRIKPKETKNKWRPFRDSAELFAHNDGKDILWLKSGDTCRLVIAYNDKTVQFNAGLFFTMPELLSSFTFKDGTPCGVEEDA